MRVTLSINTLSCIILGVTVCISLSINQRTRMSVSTQLKARLKPFVVPIWNAAHRCAWLAYDYLGAIASGRFGRCIVCGRLALFIYRRRVVTPRLQELWGLSPRLADALARKESGDCAHCGAKLRGRRIAQVLLTLYSGGAPPAPSLARWGEAPEIRKLRVAEINRIDGVHSFVVTLPFYAGSDYSEGDPASGDPEARSEDLTRLSYDDESFDLILTSETLEHVPDLHAAVREIHRVLAPGGLHVFTVPVLPGTKKTVARAIIGADGSIRDELPRICHPGGDWGYPVFTEIGTDLPELLTQAGFQADIHFGPVSEDDLAQVYVCRKPAV
jgi:SAM-dependent methyltransferase